MAGARAEWTPEAGGRVVVRVGALLAAVAVALHLTQLSRAVGFVVGSVAAVLVVAGVGIGATRRWPPRSAVILFGIAVAGLVLLGAFTWVTALQAENTTGL